MMTLGCIHIRVVSTSQHTSSGLHRPEQDRDRVSLSRAGAERVYATAQPVYHAHLEVVP